MPPRNLNLGSNLFLPDHNEEGTLIANINSFHTLFPNLGNLPPAKPQGAMEDLGGVLGPGGNGEDDSDWYQQWLLNQLGKGGGVSSGPGAGNSGNSGGGKGGGSTGSSTAGGGGAGGNASGYALYGSGSGNPNQERDEKIEKTKDTIDLIINVISLLPNLPNEEKYIVINFLRKILDFVLNMIDAGIDIEAGLTALQDILELTSGEGLLGGTLAAFAELLGVISGITSLIAIFYYLYKYNVIPGMNDWIDNVVSVITGAINNLPAWLYNFVTQQWNEVLGWFPQGPVKKHAGGGGVIKQ